MSESLRPIRDFLLQLEKSLKTRKLYASDTPPYQEAGEKLFEKYRDAAAESEFTLRFAAGDLFVGKTSVLNRDKREESFFFPLYRDGLRELTFSENATAEELDELVGVLEAERKGKIGPSDETVSLLWRCDLQGITYRAIDGIGDEEGDGTPASGTEEYSSLVADLMSKIQDPAPASTGQGYAFVLDADTRVAATDLHYQATTKHKSFEENPTVLRLSPEEVSALRTEVEHETDEELLVRFIEILFFILMDATGNLPGANIRPVLEQLLEGFWKAKDYSNVLSLLQRLKASSTVAPLPDNRDAARDVLQAFLTPDRIREDTLEPLKAGTLRLEQAIALWEFAGDEIWDLVVGFWCSLPQGELHAGVGTFLRNRLPANPDLLRQTLADPEPERVRGALALLSEGVEGVYVEELVQLSTHSDMSIRLKALPPLARIDAPVAVEALWKVMEADPAKKVRLLAFRLMSKSVHPQLANRLRTLVTHPGFASRPVWEREKYIRLLGAAAGERAQALFESWVPSKRWFWKTRDYESAQLALCGLAACGGTGLEKVKALATGKTKLATLAQKAIRLQVGSRSGEPRSRSDETPSTDAASGHNRGEDR